MGKISFAVHGFSVLGVIGTLFYLIYSHQYQYHYVWNHSSNELPVHYMISCFWEGQEGSFLLWSFWHVILAALLMFTTGKWRNAVMSVVMSVNLILASMILGVYVPENIATALFVTTLLAPAGYFAYRAVQSRDSLGSNYLVHLGGIVLALLGTFLAVSGKTGGFSIAGIAGYTTLQTVGYGALFLLLLGYIGILIYHLTDALRDSEKSLLSAGEIFAAMSVIGLTFVAMTTELGIWKVGSTPFLLLRDAFPGAPVFASNPDFVPANGTGLNPLLQNYWMVIHPPTLFLGFASTVVPFAFVIGGLMSGRYKEWIRPSAPWTIFSVAILGVGIIMGGYWAYETLNFGGYWNWDPVENSSFVPWLFGVAALHAMVTYRKSKLFLKTTMFMVISVFLFVLYSTFLTRSGILGETSVHTFTDLGLSGQLVLLVVVYLFGIAALYLSRTKAIPSVKRELPYKSAEFVLFLGVLVLFAAGLEISMFTSIPVFNKILGTNWATPAEGGFFYYRWTVWFAVALAILSGIAQYLFWRRQGKKSIRQALTRPYFLAMGIAVAIILAIVFLTRWEFNFDDEYRSWKELADNSPSLVSAAVRYVRLGFFTFADEIMLLTSLFMVLANADVLIHLLRRTKKTRKVTGGSIAHIGFGLMLLGFLFSSGYDQVISKNVNPNELAVLPTDARIDNVLLEKNRPRNIVGYQVTYVGKKEALPPIHDMEVITRDESSFKVSFRDSTGDLFAYVLPADVFSMTDGSLNIEVIEQFLNEKLDVLKPKHINDRTLYGVRFVPRKLNDEGEVYLQENRAFTLYPEAEINPTMGLVAHPSRKILPESDIYVHVSTIPKEEEAPEFEFYNFELGIGDTVQTARAAIYFDRIVSEPADGTPYDLIARADLMVTTDRGSTLAAQPLYRIDQNNRVTIKDHFIEEIHTSIAFTGVNTQTGRIFLQIQEQTNAAEDVIVIQALKKPFINVLWLGTFVLVFGFGIAIYRRIRENMRLSHD
ncbi:MAG: cytochrome c biogenesis protein CcsA [Bacteroidota bacterium]